jgi:hypothetical protein
MHILRRVLDDGDEKNRERPSSFLFAKERRDKERERKATFSLSNLGSPLCQNNFKTKLDPLPLSFVPRWMDASQTRAEESY